jgi:hypothetical protein
MKLSPFLRSRLPAGPYRQGDRRRGGHRPELPVHEGPDRFPGVFPGPGRRERRLPLPQVDAFPLASPRRSAGFAGHQPPVRGHGRGSQAGLLPPAGRAAPGTGIPCLRHDQHLLVFRTGQAGQVRLQQGRRTPSADQPGHGVRREVGASRVLPPAAGQRRRRGTMENIIADAAFLEFAKVKFVWDMSFFSVRNVNALYRAHYKFIGALRPDTALARSNVEAVRDRLVHCANYLEDDDVYCISTATSWDYAWSMRDGREERGKRRLHEHVCYNERRAAAESSRFNRDLKELKAAVQEGKGIDAKMERARLLLTFKATPARGTRVEYNDEAIRQHTRDFGYFVLLSNEVKEGDRVLEIYLNKDLVEKDLRQPDEPPRLQAHAGRLGRKPRRQAVRGICRPDLHLLHAQGHEGPEPVPKLFQPKPAGRTRRHRTLRLSGTAHAIRRDHGKTAENLRGLRHPGPRRQAIQDLGAGNRRRHLR